MNTYYLYFSSTEEDPAEKWYYGQISKKLDNMTTFMRKSLEFLENVDSYYQNAYTVDGCNTDSFNGIIEEISSRRNYINYTIIPAANCKK